MLNGLLFLFRIHRLATLRRSYTSDHPRTQTTQWHLRLDALRFAHFVLVRVTLRRSVPILHILLFPPALFPQQFLLQYTRWLLLLFITSSPIDHSLMGNVLGSESQTTCSCVEDGLLRLFLSAGGFAKPRVHDVQRVLFQLNLLVVAHGWYSARR